MNEVLKHATIWMNLQKITLNAVSQTQKDNIVWFHLYKISKIDKLIETDGRFGGYQNWWREKCSYCLLDTVAAWAPEIVLEIDRSDACITLWMQLMSLFCTLKNYLNGKFYLIYILLKLRKLPNWHDLKICCDYVASPSIQSLVWSFVCILFF